MDNYFLTDKDFKLFADLVYSKTGINLYDGDKKQLVQSRVSKDLRKREIPTYKDYYDIIIKDTSNQELEGFINLISTNVTNFFREEKHFDFLKTIWHLNFDYKHSEPVRIWCAASSSGEEPYSISITMYDLVADKYPYEILATDISTKVLKIAMRGVYEYKAVEKIPIEKIKKYFKEGSGNAAGFVKVKQNIQKPIKFERLNLIEPFSHKNYFDIIFCRNVMIYFDAPTKEKIVNRFYDYMHKGAYLLIGHSESLNGLKHPFQYVQPATYRKI